MISSSFEESNVVLDPPEGVSLDDCSCLSVFRGEDQNGVPTVISCWKFTQEELEEVNRSGRIWLGVMGETMPPVWLTPFKQDMQDECGE